MKKQIVLVLVILLGLISCKEKQEIQPQRKDIIDAVFASGKIVANKEYQVTAINEGYLDHLWAQEGDTITIGQPLFQLVNDIQQIQLQNAALNYQYAKENQALESPQMIQAQEKIKQAEQKLRTDSINVARYQKLLPSNAVARVDYDKVLLEYQNDQSALTILKNDWLQWKRNLLLNTENAKSQFELQNQNNRLYTLHSETNGQLLNVFKKKGDLVKKGETIGKIGSGLLVAKLYVAEDDIQRIQMDQPILITLNTDKDSVYSAKVSKLYPSFDEISQSFIVEATFTTNPKLLKIGTQLQANFIISEKKNALVVPTNYLIGGDSVQLVGDRPKVKVKIGIKTVEWTEILSGITEVDVIENPIQL
jgi:multidrug efflux pump subunit AcrA (membrane-fusion protein)